MVFVAWYFFRSLATGSTSHKTVKSDVSRILWYYYNDNVGLSYDLALCAILRLPTLADSI
jgi:hypothetical protein